MARCNDELHHLAAELVWFVSGREWVGRVVEKDSGVGGRIGEIDDHVSNFRGGEEEFSGRDWAGKVD